MCHTEPLCEATPASVDFDLFLVVVPHSIVKLKVNPLGYVWRFSSGDFNPSALLLSARNPIQDVGLIYQAVIPQTGCWHFTRQHAIPPSLLELSDFSLSRIILVRLSNFRLLQLDLEAANFLDKVSPRTINFWGSIRQEGVGDADIVGKLCQCLCNFRFRMERMDSGE